MADEQRTVIIDVEVEQKDFDKEIGEVNSKLKENREEIKELSKDYDANATSIAKLEAENRDLAKSKGQLIKESNTEKGSLNALRLELVKQVKERNELNKSTEEGSARFDELQDSIGDLNEEISGFEEAGGDFRRNVGNYPSLADNASGAIKGLWTTLLANPLIALVAGLAGLVKLFSESQAGAEFFQKAGAALSQTLGFLRDIVEDLGVFLIDIFSDPEQAIKDLRDLIVENITNRIVGLLELIPALGEAFSLALKFQFAEAAEVATDAVAKVVLGVEDFTKKIKETTKNVVEFFAEVVKGTEAAFALEERLIANTKALADLAVSQAQSILQQKELNLIVEDVNRTFAERIAAAEEFAAVEAAQIAESIKLQEKRIKILKEQNDITNSTEEDIQRVRDAEIELSNLQSASFERELTNQTKLNSIITAQRSEQLAAEKAAIAETDRLRDEEIAAKDAARKQEAEQDKQLADLKKQLQEDVSATIFSILGRESKIGKALAAGTATINTLQGMTKALAQGGIFGIAAAATVGATGFAAVSRILNTQLPNVGGGGGGFGQSATSLDIGARASNVILPGQAPTEFVDLSSQVQGEQSIIAGISNSFRNMKAPQVAVTDINQGQDNRQVKVNEANLTG